MFEMRGVDCFYGQAQVLRSFSLKAEKGEILCLLGRNGAGKTTALKAIMGLVPARGGTITLDGTELSKLPAHEVPRHGVGYVPQGRRLFSDLTVMENLKVGLMTRNSGPQVLEHVLGLFPLLKDRLTQRAGTRPIMAFSAVVLPAPLRPSRHRISPLSALSEKERSTCAAP